MRAEVDGEHLSDEEIYSFLRLLLPAGVETTYRATGSLLFALLNDRAQFDALYDDRSLYPQAFEEAVRWEPPVTVILRRAARDTELAGVPIEAGADIALLIGAANRDERKYTDPDRYDMFREQRQHVGFGFGVHVCLGMHLARMESRVAINTLFDRLGPVHAGPDGGAARTSRDWPSARRSRCRWCSSRFGPMAGRHRDEPLMAPDNPLRDAAAIVGIGQTEFAKSIDRPEGQLAAEAVVAALRDAGIAPAEVDGLSLVHHGDDRRGDAGQDDRGGRHHLLLPGRLRRRRRLRHHRPRRHGHRHRAGRRGGGLAFAQAGGADLAAVGGDAVSGCPSRPSGPGPSACCARWTRWPCWPGATCTSTAPGASTWPRWPWPCGPTPTATRPR